MKLNNKKISVILPVYNEDLKFIKESVQSILEQTYSNFELIIIVDNPDISNSIFTFLNILKSCDDRISILYNNANIGLARSLNVGIEASTGEYIARMDADDISINNRFEKQIDYFANNNIDLLSTNISVIDMNDRIVEKKKYVSLTPDLTLPYYCSLFHPTIMVKSEILKKNGGYCNIRISEDYELYLRLLQKNVKMAMLDEPLLLYRIRDDSILNTNSFKSRRATEFIIKNYMTSLIIGKYSFSKDMYYQYIHNIDFNENAKYNIAHNTIFRIKREKSTVLKLLFLIESLVKSLKWTLVLLFEIIRNRLITFYYNKKYLCEQNRS